MIGKSPSGTAHFRYLAFTPRPSSLSAFWSFPIRVLRAIRGEVCLLFFFSAVSAALAEAPPATNNLLPNPSFEMVEPPPPTPATAQGQPVPPETFRPRTWDIVPHGGAEVLCPEDAATAHSGKRCVRLKATQGRAVLRYSMAPVPFKCPWTVRLWARGSGKLTATMYQVGKDK